MKTFELMDIPERIKYLREEILKIIQSEMSVKLSLQRGSLSDIERKKTKTVTDRVINDICREYNVNENWLRFGKGEIFIQPDTFSLDEYAKKNSLTDLELDIIRACMDLDKNTRQDIIKHFKIVFEKHSEAASQDNSIDVEVGAYRTELEATQKGGISAALEDIYEKKA